MYDGQSLYLQAISDELFAGFVSGEADKVELVYTKFISLITSDPIIQTLLPMTPAGELCNIDGTVSNQLGRTGCSLMVWACEWG
jgi:F0F1-type ATP synthase gamma subunit